jgi:hypothetical protein
MADGEIPAEVRARYEARFGEVRVGVARRLWDQLNCYVAAQHLGWTPALRDKSLGYKRHGGYFVVIITLSVETPVELAVKLPDSPESLELPNPYPHLESSWDAESRYWTWAVPTLGLVPDPAFAMCIARDQQPVSGPMPDMRNINPRVEDRMFAALTSSPAPATVIYMQAMCIPRGKTLIGAMLMQRQAASIVLEKWAKLGLIARHTGWKNYPNVPTFSTLDSDASPLR